MANIKYVVDTHALIWFFEDSPKLGKRASAVLDSLDSKLVLPIIALAEACWIVERGRTNIPSVAELTTSVDADPRFIIAPLDLSIIEKSNSLLTIGEMHDRQIVATGLLLQEQGHQVALLTKDANIVASKLVTVVW